MVRAMTSPRLDAKASSKWDETALLNELAGLHSVKIGQTCQAASELAKLPEKVREAVEGILWHRPDVSTAALLETLARNGLEIRDGNMRRHRRLGPTGCKCPGKPKLGAAAAE